MNQNDNEKSIEKEKSKIFGRLIKKFIYKLKDNDMISIIKDIDIQKVRKSDNSLFRTFLIIEIWIR